MNFMKETQEKQHRLSQINPEKMINQPECNSVINGLKCDQRTGMDTQLDCLYLIARMLKFLGRKEEAVKVCKRILRVKELNRWSITMTFLLAKELGMKPYKIMRESVKKLEPDGGDEVF